MPIKRLPREVISRIAAGEVVERPASVVKELVENSIDAGATRVKVEVRDAGKRLIRVTDNGAGIPAEEVVLAFHRYSTSKIATTEDLQHITTLGFRGEALASIAAVAQVKLFSATDEESGVLVRVEGGRVLGIEPGAGCQGTVVTVENLFFNMPARRRFLKSDATEMTHIARLVTAYALAYPEISFALISDGKVRFHSPGSGELFDVLSQLYTLADASRMLPVESPEDSPVRISGYVSPPGLTRSRRDNVFFLVNGRWIQSPMLARALEGAYARFLPRSRHPLAVIVIDLPPEQLDVNVHPAKREVKFLHPNQVFSALQRAVRGTLKKRTPFPVARKASIPTAGTGAGRRGGKDGYGFGELALEVQRTAGVGAIPLLGLSEALSTAKREVELPPLRVLGQVAATYIVAEGPDGLYIIDQHAAHERVILERLKANNQVVSQDLLEPVVLEVAAGQEALVEEASDKLAALGFRFEPFGPGTIRLRAVPAVLVGGDVEEAVRQVLECAAGSWWEPQWEEEALVAIACHSAVKAGQALSRDEQESLIEQLRGATALQLCPHGRPTVIRFSKAQLEKAFLRKP